MVNSFSVWKRNLRGWRILLFSAPLILQAACTSRPSGKNDVADAGQFYSVADFADVPKTDVHIHIFTEGNDFMDIASDLNFKVVNVALDARNDMARVRRQFRFCEMQKEKNPTSVEMVTAFSMDYSAR